MNYMVDNIRHSELEIRLNKMEMDKLIDGRSVEFVISMPISLKGRY